MQAWGRTCRSAMADEDDGSDEKKLIVACLALAQDRSLFRLGSWFSGSSINENRSSVLALSLSLAVSLTMSESNLTKSLLDWDLELENVETGADAISDDWEIVSNGDQGDQVRSDSTSPVNEGPSEEAIKPDEPTPPVTEAPNKAPGLKRSKAHNSLVDLVRDHPDVSGHDECHQSQPVPNQHQGELSLRWPMDPFSHLASSVLVIPGLGRFIVDKHGIYIGEHVGPADMVNFVLTIEQTDGRQTVSLHIPIESSPLPDEAAEPVSAKFLRQYMGPELPNVILDFYRLMSGKALLLLSAKTPQIDFHHMFSPDNRAQLMYNGDFYMHFGTDRSFMQSANDRFVRAVGEDRTKKMTPTELKQFLNARREVEDYHNMFRYKGGKYYVKHRVDGNPACSCFSKVTVVGLVKRDF